jgi:hypothetical protein
MLKKTFDRAICILPFFQPMKRCLLTKEWSNILGGIEKQIEDQGP